ncbi:hypothetical protein QR680_013336 [Steinernema hermaphroditum]|uniref:Uncharacterized protein n=1 Tax=Steinernema hermaphroditum TaxID=289476 RepID=A0AA39I7Z2_9BILA|nr:hypothetical protein QR680_013336 [Steinernema hermaphroditum]
MSCQSTLPNGVSPGWNDPPQGINTAVGSQSSSRLPLNQRHRRPVDPSIQGMFNHNSTSSTPQPLGSHPTFSSAPQLQAYQHQAPTSEPNGFPHPAHHQPPHLSHNASQPHLYPYPPPQQAQMSAAPATQVAYAPPSPHSIPAPPQQQPPVANGSHVSMATHHHKAVYDAFTVHGGSKGYDFAAVRPASSQPSTDAHNAQAAPPPTTTIPFQQNFTDPERSVGPSNLPVAPVAPMVVKPPPRQNIEHDPSALIFSPPNSIASDFQRPVTQPDPNNYRPPVKAAGDVSLTGPQLVAFLTKATVRLPQGPTCQGIQLRFSQLLDLVYASRVSEGCLKKLNFVVDAIDRELYDDAWAFYDQLQGSFGEEMASWGQGVKLLILELVRIQKKSASQAGSASVSRLPTAQSQTQRALSAGFSKFM